MHDYQEIIKLAEKAVIWYHNNESELEIPLHKKSSVNPKYSDEIWAGLMVDAISAFYSGLDSDDSRTASNDKNLYYSAVDLVGSGAFNTIAFLVAAAGAREPIEEAMDPADLETAFEDITSQPGTTQKPISAVTDLSAYATTPQDEQALYEVQSNIVDINNPNITQQDAHNAMSYLQQYSAGGKVSQPLAQAIGSLAVAYQNKADELTRSSGYGARGSPQSGLPTGVSIQGM